MKALKLDPVVVPEIEKVESKWKPEDIQGHNQYQIAIRFYLTGEGKISKSNPYKIIKGELWFIRPRVTYAGGHGLRYTGKYHKDILCKKVNGVYLGNSSGLARSSKGRTGSPLAAQLELGQYIPMVPYGLFEGRKKLDINSFVLVDKGPDEELDLGRKNKHGEKIMTHFTGAMLFNIGSQQYLFDIDRNDLVMKNFNAFMSRLGSKVKTIDEAYKSLKPKEVYDAERFLKAAVPRQGEWFFIPVHGKRIPPLVAEKSENGRLINAVLQSKGNRAHYVEEKCGEYVRGRVWHGGYEHKDITLKEWHRPVPNTAIESFKISGAID